MSAPATPVRDLTPFSVYPGEVNDDTTAVGVDIEVTFRLSGSVASVQADYATLAAVALTSTATIDWDGD